MNNFGNSSENFSPRSLESSKIIAIPDAVEALLYPEKHNSYWPEEIKNNETIKSQIEIRKNLINNLDSVFGKIPHATTDIKEAISTNKIESADATEMYKAFIKFFESDKLNARIALYIPFELIPEKNWGADSSELNRESKKFTDIYMQKWHELLNDHNIRANFSDGDIPEQELRTGPLPKVNKAAHLIPILVQKKLLSVDEIIKIAKKSNDKILKNSIADTIPVLADLNLLSENDMENLSNSDDSLLNSMAIIIKDNIVNSKENKKNNETVKNRDWLIKIVPVVSDEITEIEYYYKKQESKLPPNRINWEKQIKENKIIEKYSKQIASALEKKELTPNLISILTESDDKNIKILGIQSIRENIENIAKSDITKAKRDQMSYDQVIKRLWKNNPETHGAIESLWSRWAALETVNQNYLDQFGIKLSKFDAPFSHKEIRLESEIKSFSEIAKTIEGDKELSKFVYPISIIYGSKVKGYNERSSDTDVAVFIKPETKIEDREKIQKLLQETLDQKNINEKIVEYWLINNGENLHVLDFNFSDKTLGDSSQVHVLVEGIWCGKDESIKELYKKLLPEYIYSKDKRIFDREARPIWLKEMERDILQYRLMHKGYARHFPEQGGLKTEHSDEIDGESAFWDSGYRRIATKLFLTKVFLPQIEK